MGTISSAQRDSKQDTVEEASAGQDGALEDSAEDKLLQKNGQISSLNEKTESQADESNGTYEERVLAEVGSGFVTLNEDGTETTDDLQEGDTSQERTEELDKEMINADGVTVKEDDEIDKQNDIEVGFKKIFRFVGFKFTLKKDKCDKSDTEEQTTNEQDKKAAISSEHSRDTTEDSPVSTDEADEMQKNIPWDNVQAESKQGNTAPETDNETEESRISEITQNTPDKEQLEEVAQSPEPEEPMSPIKRFFTQGIFASLRKKRKEEEASKEKNEEELKRSDKEEDEKLGEAARDSTCICLDISNITPGEGRDLQTGGRDWGKPAAEGELTNSQEQDKVQASPLKRLFRKLSTRRQRETKPTETTLTEPGENLNESLQSSAEVTKDMEVMKEEEEAKVEEPKPVEEDQITDISPEESKKKSDSTVSWESLICIGSNKKRARKTSNSEDAMQDKDEEARKTAESPLESSTEGGYDQLTSSNEQAGSATEEESGSTWKSLKKLVTPKRKGRMEENGSSEQIPSDTETTKDESSCSIKNLIPGRKKRKFDGLPEHPFDEAVRGTGTDNEDDETPEVVPLSEYEIIEPESLKEITDGTELEKVMQPMIEEDKPKETVPSVKPSYDKGPLVVPVPSDYIEDLTEFISKHQQLSDIPEEGIIEESVVTPVSSAEWTTQDDTLAEDIVELTADAVTAPEPVSEQFSGEETTEMVSAVSQLTESPKTSGNVTPVPPEYDLRQTDVIIQEVVETMFMTPSVMSITLKDKDPEALAVSVSPCCVETPITTETKVLVAHEKAEATFICTGLVSQEIGAVEEVLPLALVEGMSECSEAVSTELISEDLIEGPVLAGLTTDDFCTAEVKEIMHEGFLPDMDNSPRAETENEEEEIFQMHVDLMEKSRMCDISMMVQDEELKEYTTEAINGNEEPTSVQMAVFSAVLAETPILEEQVTAKTISEVPLDINLNEPVHEEPTLYTEITVEDEEEHRLPDVTLSATDVEQVTLADVVESEAQNVIVAGPDSIINEASVNTEDAVHVTLSEVVEAVTENVVVSESTLDEALETTERMVGVFAPTVEYPETTDVISIVSPVSDSIKVVAVELENEVHMENVPSLRFGDSHEIQVEVKNTELEMATTNIEAAPDVATAVNVKVEEIREGVTEQPHIEPIPAEESGEIFAEDIVHDTEVENLLEIVTEPTFEENELIQAVKVGSPSSGTTDEPSATEEPQDAAEAKLDTEKEHSESDVTLVEDHETKQNTEDEVCTVTPNEAEMLVEHLQAPVISEQTDLQEESAREGCQLLTMDDTEEKEPENQTAELSLDTHGTKAAPESSTEASEVTEETEAVSSAIHSEDVPEDQEGTALSEINSQIAKEPQEIIQAGAPSPQIKPEVSTDQQQTETVTSKPEEGQATESSPQVCMEDKQVAEDIKNVNETASEAAVMNVEETKQSKRVSSTDEGSNEMEQTCEVEMCTIAQPEVEICEEPVATVQHLETTSSEDRVTVPTTEAVKVEALLIVKQEPAIEVSEPAVVGTKDIQESNDDVREQKADTPCVTIQEVTALQVEKAVASEMNTEKLPVMDQKKEPSTAISEAGTTVSVELVTEPPVVAENETETPAVMQPEVQTQVMNELNAETLEVTVPNVETQAVTEVKLETAVVTELEVETSVVTSVVAELEVETPVVTSAAKNIDKKNTDLPLAREDTEVQPVLPVKLPEVAQGATVGEIPTQGETVTETLVPEIQTPASKEEEMMGEISDEKDIKVKTPVAVEATEPKLEMPKAEETIIQTAVSELEAQIPAVTSALETETLVGTCEEKNLDAQSPVVTSVKEFKEVINEPQLKIPVIPAVQTSVVVPTIQMPEAVASLQEPEVPTVTPDIIETKAETPAFDVNTPKTTEPEEREIKVHTAVVTEVEVNTLAAASELKVAPVKEEEAEPAIALVINPPAVAPEVRTETKIETPTNVPPVEKPTVVQTPAVVQMVQTLTADKNAKTLEVAPEVPTLTKDETPTNVPPAEKPTVVQTPAVVQMVPTLTADKEAKTPEVAPEVQTLRKDETPTNVPPAEKPTVVQTPAIVEMVPTLTADKNAKTLEVAPEVPTLTKDETPTNVPPAEKPTVVQTPVVVQMVQTLTADKEAKTPEVAPEVQTLTKDETPTNVPPAEKPTVVQTPTVVQMVQKLTADKDAKIPEVAPDVMERCKEALAAAEAEPPSLTEAEVKLTEQVTSTAQSTTESKEDRESLETLNRGPEEVSMVKAPEALPDVEDDVWEDAVDDIKVDECIPTKAGV